MLPYMSPIDLKCLGPECTNLKYLVFTVNIACCLFHTSALYQVGIRHCFYMKGLFFYFTIIQQN
jgi:hypothetical protein